MAIQSHTWAVGEVVTAANMNTYVRDNIADLDSRLDKVKTGTYSGDGTTSQAITGVGFQPIYLKIWDRQTVHGVAIATFETTDTIVDDNAQGGCFAEEGVNHYFLTDRIIALGADGFTVDDEGADAHPNKNGITYNYYAVGA